MILKFPLLFIYAVICYCIAVLLLPIMKVLEFLMRVVAFFGITANNEALTTSNYLKSVIDKARNGKTSKLP